MDSLLIDRDPNIRRQWKRYRVRGGAMVVLNKKGLLAVTPLRHLQLGPIIDISLGGIAAQYIETGQRKKRFSHLAIATMKGNILIDELGFEVARDSRLALLPDNRIIRCRCLRFVNLSQYQNYQLETFINTYGVNPQNDRRAGTDRRRYQDPRFNDPEFRLVNERRQTPDRRRTWRTRKR